MSESIIYRPNLSPPRPEKIEIPIHFHPGDDEKTRQERLAWAREAAEERRRLYEARSHLFTAVGLWKVCEHKSCRRNKSCRGDTNECAMKRWRRYISDEDRIYLGKVCHYVADEGMTLGQALDAADADLKEREEIAARHVAKHGARPPAVPDER